MIKIKEESRKIQFDNGQSVRIENVVGYSSNDSTLGIYTDDYMYIINPDKVLYHKIKPIGRATK